jgi:AcrR family transcriptional regulator
MEKISENKRVRRTNAELEACIERVVRKQILEKGFANITLLGIAREAKVETTVLYKRYGSLNGLLKTFARKYDFWFSTLFEVDEKKTPRENMKQLFRSFIIELYDNDFMQQFLLWELADKSEITRQMSNEREENATGVLAYYRQYAEELAIDMDMFLAIMISAIYYLILHRKISTFSLIDFNNPEGKPRLLKTMDDMVDLLFDRK